ncbi:hypothetical protein D9M72_407470 [compost metagenome]
MKTTVAIGFVADEIDLGDLGALTFIDHEGKVDAPFGNRNDLRRYRDVAAADGSIGVLDGLDIRFDCRFAVRAERLRAHDALQLVVLDLAVAVEDDLIDQLILAHADDQRTAGDVDADVGEVARGVQALHGSVDIRVAEGLAGNDRDVRSDRLSADARCPAYFDTIDDRSFCDGRACEQPNTSARNNNAC